MTRIKSTNWLVPLLALLAAMSGAVQAATPGSGNPLLGKWRVEALPGDQSAQALQCRTMAEIEFREKSVTIQPRTAGAEKGDGSQMAVAAGLMGIFTQMAGSAQGSSVSRAQYEQEGTNWFVTLRDFGGGALVLNLRGTDELMMQDPRCLLKRIKAASAAPSPGSVAGEGTAKPSRSNAKPVALERIVEGFGVVMLDDLRQTLKQKGMNIVFDGTARPPFSHSLMTRGAAGMPGSEFPVTVYSFDAAGKLRAFSIKRPIAERTAELTQVGGSAETPGKHFDALVNNYSSRYKLLQRQSSARPGAAPAAGQFTKRFGPESEVARFVGETVKVTLSRIDSVLVESYEQKSEPGAGADEQSANARRLP